MDYCESGEGRLQEVPPVITPDLLQAFLKCQRKSWLISQGIDPENPPYVTWNNEREKRYQQTASVWLAGQFPEGSILASPSVAELVSETWQVARNVRIRTEISGVLAEVVLHAVERHAEQTKHAKAGLIPVRFIRSHKRTRDDKLLLGLDALVLSQVRPDVTRGKIVFGDRLRTSTMSVSAALNEVRIRLMKLATLLSGGEPEPVLNPHCAECGFRTLCRMRATDVDDLSLLAKMTLGEREHYRKQGILTVTQLSYTFRARKTLTRRHRHALRALAIRERKVHVIGDFILTLGRCRMYLDVEGIPDQDWYYLIGVRIEDGDVFRRYSFWADSMEEEGKIWREFLRLFQTIREPVLIHYGSYETTFLRRMTERHGLLEGLGEEYRRSLADTVNLLSSIFETVYFPTYSNGLKDIAQYLGFGWSVPEASGLHATMWREQWVLSGDEQMKQKIITYNADDCEALACLARCLETLSSNGKAGSSMDESKVVRADKLQRSSQRFHAEYTLPDLEVVNKAAYWDYQRQKVLIRSSARLKQLRKAENSKARSRLPVNKTVLWPGLTTCPNCGGGRIHKNQNACKTVVDLRFDRAGIRRWVVKYRFHRYRCKTCRAVFHNRHGGWSGEKYGKDLRSFCIYQNIELRMPQRRIRKFLNEVLGFQLPHATVNGFKSSTARLYQDTYNALLKEIATGSLVHADETTVNLGTHTGYVWVFTNLEQVVYCYSPTREGELAARILEGFRGVLVTDFYSAYDSLPCPQQKCLIHLIRDLNDDLLKEPYNAELRTLAGEFGVLLRAIVETVDRFGLKARFLNRHQVDVDRFFELLLAREYKTTVALQWKQRLERNRGKLFTFLHYDDVPWNNNNAEHAVKAFAMLRKEFEGLSTEQRISEYLILLSVCETCAFLGISFLEFLRSGEKDVRSYSCQNNARKQRADQNCRHSSDAIETDVGLQAMIAN